MKETTITYLSEILTDEFGYPYVDLEFKDGTKGFYHNTVEVLSTLKLKGKVTYLETKDFNMRTKIMGLHIHNNNNKKEIMAELNRDIIVKRSKIRQGENNKFLIDIVTEKGVEAIHFSDNYNDLTSLKVGSVIEYKDIKEVKGNNLFVGLSKKSKYTHDQARQLSITRQSNLKLAVEIAKIAYPKGKWATKDGGIDIEAAYTELTELAERFTDYTSPE